MLDHREATVAARSCRGVGGYARPLMPHNGRQVPFRGRLGRRSGSQRGLVTLERDPHAPTT